MSLLSLLFYVYMILVAGTMLCHDKCRQQQVSLIQGSHSNRKPCENGRAFSSQGKVREFGTD